MANLVYFDLETQKLAHEVGGWSNIDRMRLALAVTYSTERAAYHIYGEQDVVALVEQLTTADLIIGFNLNRFDYVVLSPYTSTVLWRLPTFDLLERIEQKLGYRVSLDALARGTLNESKSADGVQSVKWWRQGQIDKVTEYCKKDVEITRRLYEHGCDEGYLRFIDRYGRLRQVQTGGWRSQLRSLLGNNPDRVR